jgi:thiamine transport system ATP-binding protein
MLDVRDVTVRFGDHPVLQHVSLHLGDAEVVAVLGPSGCGKSTLLRVVAGLLQPESGSVWLGGSDVTDLDVAANVGFGLRMQRVPSAQATQRVQEMLELVGLPSFAERSVQHLSGGEAKRVALARALAPRPRVLLLDEPLTGLDRELHDRLVTDLGHVLAAAGTTTLLVTHDRDEASALASRVVNWQSGTS